MYISEEYEEMFGRLENEDVLKDMFKLDSLAIEESVSINYRLHLAYYLGFDRAKKGNTIK